MPVPTLVPQSVQPSAQQSVSQPAPRSALSVLLLLLVLQLTGLVVPASPAAGQPESPEASSDPRVVLVTALGDIEVELYPDRAPVTVANFLTYVDQNRFQGATFYRVVTPDNQPGHPWPIEVVQGGLTMDDHHPARLPPIRHETTEETGLRHLDGTLSMARDEPGSATSELFITLGEQPELDFGGRRNPDGQGFAAFGRVVRGMEVVRAIHRRPEEGQMLVQPVAITAVERRPPPPPAGSGHRVTDLRVTVLSTMLTDFRGVGEWGFAALVEADGRRLLFDTGARPATVLDNARALGVDLGGAVDVVLSHHHWDHTGGLLTLRRELRRDHPAAVSRVHGAAGLFASRPRPGEDDSARDGEVAEGNPMVELKAAYEQLGGRFVVHGGPAEILPGVWLTGPVPRPHAERNWSPRVRLATVAGVVPDHVPESQSLVIDTVDGLVVISGCGHAGIVNTLEYARQCVPGDGEARPLRAALGGFHLFRASDTVLSWTADQLARLGLESFLGAHCTGIEAVYRLRQGAGLERSTAAVGAVGSVFTLEGGLQPGPLAR